MALFMATVVRGVAEPGWPKRNDCSSIEYGPCSNSLSKLDGSRASGKPAIRDVPQKITIIISLLHRQRVQHAAFGRDHFSQAHALVLIIKRHQQRN